VTAVTKSRNDKRRNDCLVAPSQSTDGPGRRREHNWAVGAKFDCLPARAWCPSSSSTVLHFHTGLQRRYVIYCVDFCSWKAWAGAAPSCGRHLNLFISYTITNKKLEPKCSDCPSSLPVSPPPPLSRLLRSTKSEYFRICRSEFVLCRERRDAGFICVDWTLCVIVDTCGTIYKLLAEIFSNNFGSRLFAHPMFR
jgi:hypothetical protein